MPDRVLHILMENFEAGADVVRRTRARMGMSDWMELTRLHRPELKDAPFLPRLVWRPGEDPDVIFDQLRYQDLLVHHPFDGFASVVPNAGDHPTWHWTTMGVDWTFRVDYIFHDKRFQTAASKVLVGPGSDHYLVVCELRLLPPASTPPAPATQPAGAPPTATRPAGLPPAARTERPGK